MYVTLRNYLTPLEEIGIEIMAMIKLLETKSKLYMQNKLHEGTTWNTKTDFLIMTIGERSGKRKKKESGMELNGVDFPNVKS